MGEQKENLIVWTCAIADHEHDSWDDAELCDLMQEQVTKLERAAIKLLLTSLSFLTSVRQQLPGADPQIDGARLEVYQRLRLKYETAGEPYGCDENGMWQWLQEQTAVG